MNDEPREYTMSGLLFWMNAERFSEPFDHDTEFRVGGFMSRKPRVGDTMKGEFEKSWMWFKFVKVEPCGNPPDQFFATVKPIRQEPKKQPG